MTTPTGEYTTIFFYLDVDAGRAIEMVNAERTAGRKAVSRDATTQYIEKEPCTAVVIMPEVPAHHVERIRKVYADVPVTELKPHEAAALPPPPSVPENRDLGSMTNKALRMLAVAKGIDVRQHTTREAMIAALSAPVNVGTPLEIVGG